MRSHAVLPCRVQPSTARLCPCVPLRARIVQEVTDSGRAALNQCNKRSESIVNLIALLRAESAAFLYQVLTNRLMCGFYTLRKFVEIKFDHSSVVQILPCGIGHSGLPLPGCKEARGVPGILRLGGSHSSTRSNPMLSVLWTERARPH